MSGDPYFGNVSLLLHMDGSNGSTTFTDSSWNAMAVMPIGNAKISTAQSQFGGSSAELDGAGDYLSVAASNGFAFGTGNFTVEFWYYHISGADRGLFATNSGVSEGVNFLVGSGGAFRIYNGLAGNNIKDFSASPAANTWQHLAVVRNSGTVTLYVDGTAAGTTDWSGVNAGNNSTFSVGAAYGDNRVAYGYIDEFRVTKGVARYTSDFTSPTEAFPNFGYPITDILRPRIVNPFSNTINRIHYQRL